MKFTILSPLSPMFDLHTVRKMIPSRRSFKEYTRHTMAWQMQLEMQAVECLLLPL